MKKNKLSITTPLLAATTVLLIAANVLLGIILILQSRSSMQSLIRARMLDISNLAATMIDGDKLEKLTAEDVGSAEYNELLGVLRNFQHTIGLEYIYCIHDDGNDEFSFTIDPDEIDPGQFGEKIEYTEALKAASLGTASVDEEPYKDKWGSFYSAYSPIYDSKGSIVGMIGVDFAAKWYEERITAQLIAVIIVSSASTVLSIIMAFTVSARIRRRFTELYEEMNSLADDFDGLNKLIQSDGAEKSETEDIPEKQEEKADEIGELGNQIRTFQSELRQYLDYVHLQAYTDAMTGVGSKTAYLKRVKSIEKHIAKGDADVSVFVFDINRLKNVNDNFGHEIGDKFIADAASAISNVFGSENVYRIGGDEFIAITGKKTPEQITALLERVDCETEAINDKTAPPVRLSVSKGAAVYDSAENIDYKLLFKHADENMYKDKTEFHKRTDGKTENDPTWSEKT